MMLIYTYIYIDIYIPILHCNLEQQVFGEWNLVSFYCDSFRLTGVRNYFEQYDIFNVIIGMTIFQLFKFCKGKQEGRRAEVYVGRKEGKKNEGRQEEREKRKWKKEKEKKKRENEKPSSHIVLGTLLYFYSQHVFMVTYGNLFIFVLPPPRLQ